MAWISDKEHRFYLLSISFLGGALARSFLLINFFIFSLVFLYHFFIAAVLGFLMYPKKGGAEQKIRFAQICFLIALSFFLGYARYEVGEWGLRDQVLEHRVETKVILSGIVDNEPAPTGLSRKFVLRAAELIDVAPPHAVHESVRANVMVFADLASQARYGDQILVEGVLHRPDNFSDDTGKEFDYVSYLAKDDIFLLIRYPKANMIARDRGNSLKAFLYGLKEKLQRSGEDAVGRPESDLLAAMLFGEKQFLNASLQQEFRDTGMIHIIILAGYSLTLITHFLWGVLSPFPRPVKIIVTGILLVLFTVMTGATSATVRAAIMSVVMLLSKLLRRKYQILRALLVAVLCMTLYNPKILAFDSAFQISCVAVLGVLLLSPVLDHYLERFFKPGSHWKEILIGCTATQLFGLPFLLYETGQLSIVGLPVNLLLLPGVPLILLFGFLSSCLGLISPWLAVPFAVIDRLLLRYILGTVRIFAGFSFASVRISFFPLWLMIGLYAAYAVGLMLFYQKVLNAERGQEKRDP